MASDVQAERAPSVASAAPPSPPPVPAPPTYEELRRRTGLRNKDSAQWMFPAATCLPRGPPGPGTLASPAVRQRLMEGTLATTETAAAAAFAVLPERAVTRGPCTAGGHFWARLSSAAGAAFCAASSAVGMGREAKGNLEGEARPEKDPGGDEGNGKEGFGVSREGGRLEVSVMRDPCNLRRRWELKQPRCHLISVLVEAGDNLADLGTKHRLESSP